MSINVDCFSNLLFQNVINTSMYVGVYLKQSFTPEN